MYSYPTRWPSLIPEKFLKKKIVKLEHLIVSGKKQEEPYGH